MATLLDRPAHVPGGRRIYAVGDIHGRLDLLEALHARIDADMADRPVAAATEIYLGDMVDRGPDSARLMIALLRRSLDRDLVMLSGNHEIAMLEALDNPSAFRRWLREGGRATVASFGIVSESANEEAGLFHRWQAAARRLVTLFCGYLIPFHIVGNYLFVHAGLRPGVPVLFQRLADMTMIREPFLGSTDDFGYVVVHGHTPVKQVDIQRRRINLDTGAYATGILSCVALEGNAVRELN